MSNGDPYKLATMRGEGVIKAREITTLPIDVLSLAADADIAVVEKKATSKGVSGMLMRLGNSFGIAYATNIPNIGFQRFSIGHELGHYFLPGHLDAVLAEDVHESKAGFSSSNHYEKEADHFSSGLLMPRQLFIPAIRSAGHGLAAIESLHDLCKTSLLATAIRYTELCREPVAIIVSQNQSIEYSFMSSSLAGLRDIDWLRKKQLLPRSSITYKFNQDQSRVLRGEKDKGTAHLQDWFGGPHKIQVTEEVVGLGLYEKTLTILHEIELPEDSDDDAGERHLEDSWSPRFK